MRTRTQCSRPTQARSQGNQTETIQRWALISRRSLASPGCRRPPVLTPSPWQGEHPGMDVQATNPLDEGNHLSANGHRAVGDLLVEAIAATIAALHIAAATHIGSDRPQSALCEHWGNRGQTRKRARIAAPGGQSGHRRSPGEKSRARSTGPGTGTADTGGPSGRGAQIVPLHLAMMRALWIWRTHEMRLMASCNQVARAC